MAARIDAHDLARFVSSHAVEPRAVAGPEALTPFVPDSLQRAVAECEPQRVAATANAIWSLIRDHAPTNRTATLNLLMLQLEPGLCPAMEADGSMWWRWKNKPTPQTFLHGSCLMSLFRMALELGWSRIDICQASDCCDVIIDNKRRARRRYCSSICLNRTRTRAYRARLSRPS
jgi:predicted RNA-binding Zn ribbon-like protein